MAVKAQNQVTILDITDSYSVILSNENQTFMETTYGSGTAAETTDTIVYSYRGSTNVYSYIPNTSIGSSHANADGVYITVESPNTNPAQELTITVHIPSGLDNSGEFILPIELYESNVTSGTPLAEFEKKFSYSVAKYGETGPGGTAPIIYELEYTGTLFNFDNTTGTFLNPSNIVVTASSQQGTNAKQSYTGGTITVTPYDSTGTAGTPQTHSTSVTITPTVTNHQPDYLYYIATLTVNGNIVDRQTIGMNRQGANGIDGEDAYLIDITSSRGFIFKNTAIATTLTAHVYQGGSEFDNEDYDDTSGHYGFGTQNAPLFVNWYNGDTAVATGTSYIISAGDISSLATITAKLESEKATISS